ncbi:MAG: hypothetical protein K2X67_03460 [Burkholderiales bacterium]|jgi:hypothetical protein|nr:hypothetical protein [Burkholderiales bacterium]
MKTKAAVLSAVALLAILAAVALVVRAYQQDAVYLTDSGGQRLAVFYGYSEKSGNYGLCVDARLGLKLYAPDLNYRCE